MNDEKTVVFEKAATLFAVLSKPIRLRIISELIVANASRKKTAVAWSSLSIVKEAMGQQRLWLAATDPREILLASRPI